MLLIIRVGTYRKVRPYKSDGGIFYVWLCLAYRAGGVIQCFLPNLRKISSGSAISEYNPNNGMITVMLSNYGDNVWARMRKIREEMY